VWAFGATYYSPADLNLSKSAGDAKDFPVSYTLGDGTVVNLGAAGASGGVISGKTKTFVGLIDQTGKGISSVTLRVQGTSAGSQPVYIEDLGFAMAGPPPGDWKLTLDEEFNGDKLDPKIWVTGYHFSDVINNGQLGEGADEAKSDVAGDRRRTAKRHAGRLFPRLFGDAGAVEYGTNLRSADRSAGGGSRSGCG